MTERERRLPCGWTPAWLLELAADGRDEPSDPAGAAHLHDCPHCRAEVAGLRDRWSPVRAAASRRVRVPPGLVDRTLFTVRAVRGGQPRRHIDVPQPHGLVRISEPTVLVLARRLARDITEALPGIRFRGLSGGTDEVQVWLAVPYGAVLADVSARVCRELAHELEVILGPATPAVHVLVEDVLAPGR